MHARDQPSLELKVKSRVEFAQFDTAVEVEAARYLHCTPFTPSSKFVTCDVGEGQYWYMLPYLLFECNTQAGTKHELIYGKWLSTPIQGFERQILPLPATFPLFQWEYVPRLGIGQPLESLTVNFGVVKVERVIRVAPIVQIGSLPQAFKHAAAQRAASRALRAHERTNGEAPPEDFEWPWKQLKRGPLFALNVHAYL